MDPKQLWTPAPSWGKNKSWSKGKVGKAGKSCKRDNFFLDIWEDTAKLNPEGIFSGIPRWYLWFQLEKYWFFFLCRPGAHPKGYLGHFSKVFQLSGGLRAVKKFRNEGKFHLRNGRNPFWASWMRDSFSTSTLEFHFVNFSFLPKDFPDWKFDSDLLIQGEG